MAKVELRNHGHSRLAITNMFYPGGHSIGLDICGRIEGADLGPLAAWLPYASMV